MAEGFVLLRRHTEDTPLRDPLVCRKLAHCYLQKGQQGLSRDDLDCEGGGGTGGGGEVLIPRWQRYKDVSEEVLM